MVKTIGCTRFLPMVNFQKRRYKWNGGSIFYSTKMESWKRRIKEATKQTIG